MSTATQQTTYTTGMSLTAAILNAEFGEIYTNLNAIYDLVDDTTGSAVITADTSNTRVGIGTTSPSKQVHVYRNDSNTGNDQCFLYEQDSTGDLCLEWLLTGTQRWLQGVDNSDSDAFKLIQDTDGSRSFGNNDFVWTTGGLFGINGSPDYHLDINSGTTNQAARFESSDGTATIGFKDDSTGGTDVQIGAVGDDVTLIPPANGDKIRLGKLPRDGNGTPSYPDSHIQRGWGYIQGDGSAHLSETVTLPITYGSTNYIVAITPCGIKVGSNPSNEGDFGGTDTDAISPQYRVITTSTFSVHLDREAGKTFASGTRYGYSWIALGPV